MPKALLALLVLLVASVAHAQRQQPTDSDLRSAYCIEVLKARIQDMEFDASLPDSLITGQATRDAQRAIAADVERLKAYVVPKLNYLDAGALLVAAERGKSDAASSIGSQNGCWRSCELKKPVTKESMDHFGTCMKACRAADPAIARVESCRPVNWLPF